MAHYVNKKDQEKMVEIIEEFLKETNNGENPTRKGDILMNELFSKYVDKIINGIIYQYSYYQYAEVDDLFNEARMHIYKAILKNTWDPKKGASIFSFFSTVVSNNLLTYTLKQSKNKKHLSDKDLDFIYENENFAFNEDFENENAFKDVFNIIKKNFKNKPKFIDITDLLELYCTQNTHKKFVKRDFIAFSKGYTYSPSLINTYFSFIKNVNEAKAFLKI